MHIRPIKTGDGKWARSNKDKAKIFAEYLESNFQPHPVQDTEITREVTDQGNQKIRLATPIEIVKLKIVLIQKRLQGTTL